MNIRPIKKIPSFEEIKNEYPISRKIAELKEKRDNEINDVLSGISDKFFNYYWTMFSRK